MTFFYWVLINLLLLGTYQLFLLKLLICVKTLLWLSSDRFFSYSAVRDTEKTTWYAILKFRVGGGITLIQWRLNFVDWLLEAEISVTTFTTSILWWKRVIGSTGYAVLNCHPGRASWNEGICFIDISSISEDI